MLINRSHQNECVVCDFSEIVKIFWNTVVIPEKYHMGMVGFVKAQQIQCLGDKYNNMDDLRLQKRSLRAYEIRKSE